MDTFLYFLVTYSFLAILAYLVAGILIYFIWCALAGAPFADDYTSFLIMLFWPIMIFIIGVLLLGHLMCFILELLQWLKRKFLKKF